MKITLKEALKQLQATHDALEEMTDRHGCAFTVAKVLCEGETLLRSPEAKAAMQDQAKRKGATIHAIH